MPMPRASGSTSRRRSAAVLVVAARAEHAAGGLAGDLGDPGALARGVAPLQVLGDDPGDERLEARVEAVLGRVQRRRGAGSPSRSRPRAVRAGRTSAGARPAVPGVLERLHGGQHAPLVGVREALEQLRGSPRSSERRARSNTAAPAAVRLTSWRRASVSRLPAGDEPVGLEAGEQPAQVAGVEVERAAEVGDRRHRPLPELVQHARLGERVRRPEQAGPEHPEPPRVEAVERAHRRDPARGRRRHR